MFFGAGKKQFLAGWRSVNSFYAHLERGTRWLLTGALAALILIIVFVTQSWWNQKKASADLASFYPAKCLGGWQYAAHAENVPDLDVSASVDDFNDINSAVLDNAMAQLYCSNFNGDDQIGTVPTKVTLRLSLAVKNNVIMTPPVTDTETVPADEIKAGDNNPEQGASGDVEQTVEQKTETGSEAATPLDNPEAATTEANPSSEPAPTPAPAPVEAPATPTEPTSWLPKSWQETWLARLMIAPAQAQEEAVVEPVPVIQAEAPVEEAQKTENEVVAPSPEQVLDQPEPVVTSEEKPVTTSSSEEMSTTSDVGVTNDELINEVVVSAPAPVMPSDALLELSYTLDGQSWQSLGWVAESNWRNVSFEVPLGGIDDWSNLDWLQVRIDRVVTLNDNQPIFYLDGMALEVQYDALAEDEVIDSDIDQPNLKKDKVLKQKVEAGRMVINVVREETKDQELWYKKINKNRATGTVEYWQKIEISGESGYPQLLDLRSGIIFWVSHRVDRKMLVAYNLETSNSNSNDVIPGGLSSLTFDEKAADSSETVANVLYYLDDASSYYFGQ